MKIALVYDLIYPFSIGGAESRYFSLAKYLVLKGHEVHLFGVKMWRKKNTIKVTKNLFIHGTSCYSNKYSFKGNRKIFEPIKYSFFLFFELLKHDFDLIDVSAFPYFPAFSCKLYSIIKKKPLVITWHEVWDEYWETQGYLTSIFGKIIEKTVAKLSKNNVCVSETVTKRLNKIGSRKEYISVFNNWINIKKINKAKPLKQKYDIISIGRHLKHKNFNLLLKISSILINKFPEFKVLIIGEGPETPSLLRMRKALKLENNVDILSFTKERKQMYRYLKSSKIFVLLSELEGFSIISFEAMAAGLPVVTIDAKRNALTEFIEDGKNGFVCKKNEIEIVHSIKKALKEHKKLSKNIQKFAKNFDVKKQIKKIELYYYNLI